VTFYPKEVFERIESGEHLGDLGNSGVRYAASSFVCGAFVRFAISVDEKHRVSAIRFNSNACGYGIASAETLCSEIAGKSLNELGGLEPVLLSDLIEKTIGELPMGRVHCGQMCIEALQGVFAAYRSALLGGFNGEEALICTCFGVSDSTIAAIVEGGASSVAEVSDICNAGSGCGSCRLIIQELIDLQINT
jgi:NifU-like protein involved in Fe-S cluster formation/bacterioferritin-associated ferredoxin